jgi:hypothetical protein
MGTDVRRPRIGIVSNFEPEHARYTCRAAYVREVQADGGRRSCCPISPRGRTCPSSSRSWTG